MHAAICWFHWLLLLPISLALCPDSCLLAERQSLQLFYQQTAGGSWLTNQGWTLDDEGLQSSSHCSWYGITCCSSFGEAETGHGNLTCDSPGAVVSLGLPQNNVAGQLTSSVCAGLSHLQAIYLPGNELTGTLPNELASAPGLIFVNLAKNSISGTLPPSIFRSSIFHTLQMDDNQLTGTLPPLGQATSLSFLSLSHNQISGPLPEDWLSSEALYEFDLEYNQLTGTIPAGGLTQDQWLFDDVSLMGTFELRIRSNHLVGDLPQALSFLPLEIMDVGENHLTGGASLLLSNTPFLFEFNVDGNQLEGTLPDNFATYSLREFHIQGNSFTGTIPSGLVNQQALISLRLDDNKLSGPVPEDLGLMGQLSLFTALNSTIKGTPSQVLPSFLKFDIDQFHDTMIPHLNCPAIVAQDTVAANLETVQLDPYYFGYENCRCDASYQLVFPEGDTMPVCLPAAPAFPIGTSIGIAVGGFAFLTLLALVGVWLFVVFWKDLADLAKKRAKLRGPPDHGKPLTLVATDIEGSTELWEWDSDIADAAIRRHDQLMRTSILKYYGHEITTEGDAFVAAFWEPADAVKFCIAVQQALMTAPWPKSLFHHPLMTPCTLTGLSGDALSVVSTQIPAMFFAGYPDSEKLPPPDEKLLFSGLRVRMSIASGKAQRKLVKSGSTAGSNCEYSGLVSQAVKAISNVTNGGQVLMDTATMTELARFREAIFNEFGTAPPATEKFKLLSHRSSIAGMALQTRRSIGIEASSVSTLPLVATQLEPRGSEGSFTMPAPEGQTSIFSLPEHSRRSQAYDDDADGKPALSGETGIMLLHMGLHMLDGLPGGMQLYQLAVPGLEERVRVLPALQTREQLGPGYLDAPAAALACLYGPQRHINLPPVTMVFCAVDHAEEMKAAHTEQFQQMLTAYRYCIRQLLAVRGGYECQEADGDFMLVFEGPVQAVNFCVQAQEALLQAHWDPNVLLLQHCCPVLDSEDRVLYAGPRVRMGIYEGTPLRIQPHASSGRADYFGRLVNRAARFCHAAAHGGQITAPLRLIQRTIRVWTSNGLVTDQDGAISAEPLHVQVPEGVDASLLPWRAAASDNLVSGCSNMHSLLHMRHQTRDFLSGPDQASGSGLPALQRQGSSLAPSAASAALRRLTAESGSGNQGARVSTSGFRLPRVKQEVHVRHIGDMRFKGVPGVQRVVDIALSSTSGRHFPAQPPSSKGKVLRAGAGLQYIVERHPLATQ